MRKNLKYAVHAPKPFIGPKYLFTDQVCSSLVINDRNKKVGLSKMSFCSHNRINEFHKHDSQKARNIDATELSLERAKNIWPKLTKSAISRFVDCEPKVTTSSTTTY